jgi:hypothetical protein
MSPSHLRHRSAAHQAVLVQVNHYSFDVCPVGCTFYPPMTLEACAFGCSAGMLNNCAGHTDAAGAPRGANVNFHTASCSGVPVVALQANADVQKGDRLVLELDYGCPAHLIASEQGRVRAAADAARVALQAGAARAAELEAALVADGLPKEVARQRARGRVVVPPERMPYW